MCVLNLSRKKLTSLYDIGINGCFQTTLLIQKKIKYLKKKINTFLLFVQS